MAETSSSQKRPGAAKGHGKSQGAAELTVELPREGWKPGGAARTATSRRTPGVGDGHAPPGTFLGRRAAALGQTRRSGVFGNLGAKSTTRLAFFFPARYGRAWAPAGGWVSSWKTLDGKRQRRIRNS